MRMTTTASIESLSFGKKEAASKSDFFGSTYAHQLGLIEAFLITIYAYRYRYIIASLPPLRKMSSELIIPNEKMNRDSGSGISTD